MMQSESTEDLTTPVGTLISGDAEDDVVHRKPPIVETILNELGFGRYQMRMIVILGVAHSTDTMETIIQAILGPSLRCDWRLTADYVALLTTLVFLGSCIGAVPLGYAADVYGRQSVCLLSCLTLMYLSWLCAISPTYAWIASLRFLSGNFIGGVLTSGSSLLSETMPSKHQAPAQLITNNFEALIGVLTAAIGLGCQRGGLNWRFFVFFTTAPLALCAICLSFFTLESPVYLYSKKRTLEAAQVLDKIAVVNRRVPEHIQITSDAQEQATTESVVSGMSYFARIKEVDETEDFRVSRIGIKEIYTLLLRRRPWLLMLLLILNFLWGFLIYGGTTILPVELATSPRTCLQDIGTSNTTSFLPTDQLPTKESFECCKPLREDGYLSLLTSASGGLFSLPIAYTFMTLLGHRWAQVVAFLLTGVLLFVEVRCHSPFSL
ncbi:unnamed protein product [Mesocestoides corti]|uniref:Major facilitator superfamily (MFS) profile domain-containing protein n=2 Tax=Mesocestoides corti TaxID=53468 RepID=A0A0R3UN71_MESCO|nr:unnamed protein product [Mesocestoides corti]